MNWEDEQVPRVRQEVSLFEALTASASAESGTADANHREPMGAYKGGAFPSFPRLPPCRDLTLPLTHVALSSEMGSACRGKGALDSACNRTVVGHVWLKSILKLVACSMLHLASWEPEVEFFRFGNGGRLKSTRRCRLPISLGGHPLYIRVSVVSCSSLGALLGKDFIKALGFVIDFQNDAFSCPRLGMKNISLQEMAAGHYVLPSLRA